MYYMYVSYIEFIMYVCKYDIDINTSCTKKRMYELYIRAIHSYTTDNNSDVVYYGAYQG